MGLFNVSPKNSHTRGYMMVDVGKGTDRGRASERASERDEGEDTDRGREGEGEGKGGEREREREREREGRREMGGDVERGPGISGKRNAPEKSRRAAAAPRPQRRRRCSRWTSTSSSRSRRAAPPTSLPPAPPPPPARSPPLRLPPFSQPPPSPHPPALSHTKTNISRSRPSPPHLVPVRHKGTRGDKGTRGEAERHCARLHAQTGTEVCVCV